MASPLSDQEQTRLALAALIAALARTLGEGDQSFAIRFDKNLERAYYALRDSEVDHSPVLQALRSTRELLKA